MSSLGQAETCSLVPETHQQVPETRLLVQIHSSEICPLMRLHGRAFSHTHALSLSPSHSHTLSLSLSLTHTHKKGLRGYSLSSLASSVCATISLRIAVIGLTRTAPPPVLCMRPAPPSPSPPPSEPCHEERICIELMTSDRKLQASREGSE